MGQIRIFTYQVQKKFRELLLTSKTEYFVSRLNPLLIDLFGSVSFVATTAASAWMV